jgi:hypothetical protein
MMTNMVEEGGLTIKNNKGVRDQRLTDKAYLITGDQDVLKQEIQNASERR